MVNQDRNVFGSCMVAMGDADSLVSGLTRSFNDTLNHITRVISSKDNKNIIGMCMVVNRDKTVFIGDTSCYHRGFPPKNNHRLMLVIEVSNSLFGASQKKIKTIENPTLNTIIANKIKLFFSINSLIELPDM